MGFKQLFAPATSNADAPKNLGLKIANLQGAGNREYQEDSFAVINALNLFERKKNGLFAVVCDGMGGLEGGKESSEFAVDQSIQIFRSLNPELDVSKQLVAGVSDISRTICAARRGASGTTLVAVRILGNQLHFISVGDSAIILKRDDFLIQLNADHILANDLLKQELQQEKICVENALSHEEADRLTSFIGMGELSEIDFNVRPFLLQPGDRLLLCSDGVSKMLCETELLEALSGTADQGVKQMEDAILSKGYVHQDNYTAIVIQVKA